MNPLLIKIWGPRMRIALLSTFRDHGVPSPDPGDVACLTAIGVTMIDRDDKGLKTTSFLGMAMFLVPALLDPKHIRHGEITAAVQSCKAQLGAAAVASVARTVGPTKAKGSLAETVKLVQAAKLPLLRKSAKVFAKMSAEPAPKLPKAAPEGRRPK